MKIQKVLSIVALVGGLFAMVVPVFAAGESVPELVSTPDPHIPPSTPTPYTVVDQTNINFSCPAGVPGGYGAVTPGPGWLSACGHCMPSATPYPTYDFSQLATGTNRPHVTPVGESGYIPGGFVTPAPTNTATATAAPTITATVSPNVLTYTGLSDGHYQWDVYASREIVCSPYGNGITCTLNFQSGGRRAGENWNINFTNSAAGRVWLYTDITATGDFWYTGTGFVHPSIGYATGNAPSYGIGSARLEGFWDYSPGNGYVNFFSWAYWQTNSVTGTIWILPQPQNLYVTPTATVTPGHASPDGYSGYPGSGVSGNVCMTIISVQDEEVTKMRVFEPTGVTRCTDIPYWEMGDVVPNWLLTIIEPALPDFYAFLTEHYFPASTVCLVEYSPSASVFLGVGVPFAGLISAMIGVWALRKISSKGA